MNLPKWLTPRSLTVLYLAIAFCILTSSGRINSGDTGAQLDAAVQFAKHFRFSVDPSPEQGLWVKSPRGDYFECHDLASQAVLVPAAFFSRSITPVVERPKLISRVLSGFTYAVLGGLTIWLMYQAFVPIYGHKAAIGLAFFFCAGTIFWAYTKTAWDVAGGAFGVAGLTAVLLRMFHARKATRFTVLGIGFWFAVACSFRFSLFPFLGVMLLMIAFATRHWVSTKSWCIGAGLCVLLMTPSFVFNIRRTGSLKPATAMAQFDHTNKLSGNTLAGLYGLTLSPQRQPGLVFARLCVAVCIAVVSAIFAVADAPADSSGSDRLRVLCRDDCDHE